MRVSTLVEALEGIAPLRYAEAWDNVGLIVGDPAGEVSRVLLCVDLTPEVLAEAASLRCEVVVAYHPPVFEGLKKVVAGSVAFEAARRGIAVYSPHTALDVAEGGTNDVLARAAGLREVRPLRVGETKARACKLVTFAPVESAEAVAEAMFAAGAGRIGNYTHCSFRTEGTGTFLGGEGSDPAVGEAGRLERAAEVKIETVAPLGKVAEVVAALRGAHPYEEPAFDLVMLAAPPETLGVGRVGEVEPVTLGALAERVKGALHLPGLLVAGDAGTTVRRVAVCAGAGRALVADVLRAGAGVYLTGELPHHDALALGRAGVCVLATLHSNSERAVLPSVIDGLRERLPGLMCVLSEKDRDPFRMA